jgi:hypothetical protein
MGLTAFPAAYDKDIFDRVFRGIANTLAAAAWRQYFMESFEVLYTLKTTGYSGFGTVPEWKDGEDLPIDEAEHIWDMTLTALFFGMAFKVTRNHERYGNLRNIQQWAASLIDSVEHTYGVIHVAPLDAAFTTNLAVLGTVPLCSASHPTVGASTRSNLLTPGAAMTNANLAVLRQRASDWVNYRGLNTPVNLNGAKLIFPSDLEDTVDKILGSGNEPGTADNDINTQRGKYRKVMEVRLTSSTAYFIQAGVHGLITNHSMLPRPVRYMENNGNLVIGVEFHNLNGVERADGIFGCAGA